jgi:hypothetical protein
MKADLGRTHRAVWLTLIAVAAIGCSDGSDSTPSGSSGASGNPPSQATAGGGMGGSASTSTGGGSAGFGTGGTTSNAGTQNTGGSYVPSGDVQCFAAPNSDGAPVGPRFAGQRSGVAFWQFLTAEVWAPSWTQCEQQPPDVFFGLRNMGHRVPHPRF